MKIIVSEAYVNPSSIPNRPLPVEALRPAVPGEITQSSLHWNWLSLTQANIDTIEASRFIQKIGGLLGFFDFHKPHGLLFFGRLFALRMVVFVSFFQGGFSVASTQGRALNPEAPRFTFKLPSSKRASVFGQFRFETLQYMTTLAEAPNLTFSQFLSGRVTAASFQRNPGSINWAADVSAGTFFSLKQSYYSLQELYVSTPLDSSATVSVGRKKYDWTEIDRYWALGLWQPRYAIDALRPEDQGLTGLFFDYRGEKLQFLAFASSLFIPTIGPEVREEDGTIKADNRWYRPPSRQSGRISLSYKIKTGDLWDLVRQDSFGLKMRIGDEERGPWLALAGGQKPVNDLLLQRCVRCVGIQNSAKFIVSPAVAHHRVFSADLGYQRENLKASLSYFEDRPQSVLPPTDFAGQEFKPVRIYSAQADWSIKEFFSRPLQAQLAYLRIFGNESRDILSDGTADDVNMFTWRYRFDHAVLMRLAGPLTSIQARPLITKFSYTYDFQQRGSILGAEFQYQWNKTWSYLAGLDILGPDDPRSTSDGFLNQFRANDRLYAGASYVF
jgi:hypothetical protein